MFVHVKKAIYIFDYKIQLEFDNNESGVIDLSSELYGEIFEPLKNINYFKSFQLNNSAGTIEWKNGADFAPEFLYSRLKKNH